MQRATLIAGGLGCLLLAAFLLERPFAGAPSPASQTVLAAQADSGTDASTGNQEPLAAKSAATEDKPESSKDAWLNALTSLEFEPFDKAAPVIARALQSPDRDVRLRAVNLLVAAKDNPAILPLVAVAQADADAEVRRNAVVALAYSSLKENLTPYLLRGAFDMDADVREALVETAWSLAPAQRDDFIAQSLSSSRSEIVSAAFEMLAHEGSTKTVSLLLNVYATNDSARIQQANAVMSALVGQTFDNAAQAASWWRDHQAEYNDDLSAKTDVASVNP